MGTWQKQRKNELLLQLRALSLKVIHLSSAILGGSKHSLLFIYRAPRMELGNPEEHPLNSSKIRFAIVSKVHRGGHYVCIAKEEAKRTKF